MSKIIPIDLFDPVDIMMNVDPDVEKLLDSIDANEDDYDTLFAGIRINEASEDDEDINDFSDNEYEDDEDIYGDMGVDTYTTIEDDSTDYLDMAADDIIDNYEDDDSDGELIDLVVAGVGPDEIN